MADQSDAIALFGWAAAVSLGISCSHSVTFGHIPLPGQLKSRLSPHVGRLAVAVATTPLRETVAARRAAEESSGARLL
eukprot:1188172-Prorocentrum_minimum.AAC.1